MQDNLRLAVRLVDEGDLEGAIAAVAKDYVAEPDDPKSYLNLGMIFVSATMPRQAIRALNAGLELKANDATMLAYRGQGYGLIGDYARAEEDFAASLKSETNIPALFGLGMLRIEQNAYNEAVESFTTIIKMYGGIPQVYAERAYALAMSGKLEAAIEDCTDALKIQPNFTIALQTRASLYEQTGQAQKAQDDLVLLKALQRGSQQVKHVQRRMNP